MYGIINKENVREAKITSSCRSTKDGGYVKLQEIRVYPIVFWNQLQEQFASSSVSIMEYMYGNADVI